MKYFYKREFLNNKIDDDRTSAIFGYIELEDIGFPYLNNRLTITGCNGTYIEFDVDPDELEDYENTVDKLNKIRHFLEEYLIALAEARTEYLKKEEERKPRKLDDRS